MKKKLRGKITMSPKPVSAATRRRLRKALEEEEARGETLASRPADILSNLSIAEAEGVLMQRLEGLTLGHLMARASILFTGGFSTGVTLAMRDPEAAKAYCADMIDVTLEGDEKAEDMEYRHDDLALLLAEAYLALKERSDARP